MIITKEWIEINATGSAAWTRAQLELLGVVWPPKKGWKSKAIGQPLADERAREFERLGAARRQRLARNLVANMELF